tara:strand:- start:226 stop:501 length:276 start_codon:yes stop_codon:yes gene_type:complete
MGLPVTHHVKCVLLVPLQMPGSVLGQQRVLLVPLACIHYRRTLNCVRPANPLPTPPLSNAPLLPIKQLQPVTQNIMKILVMPLVQNVMQTL